MLPVCNVGMRLHGGGQGAGIEAERIAHEADGYRDLVVERARQPGKRERPGAGCSGAMPRSLLGSGRKLRENVRP